jgi:hypothetical protein
VADEDDAGEAELLHDRGDVAAIRRDRPVLAAERRLAVSGEIDGDDFVGG